MDHLFVLTGPPGSGKTTLLQQIAHHSVAVVPEPARQIIAEQRAIDGVGVSETNPRIFVELMLSRALYHHAHASTAQKTTLFDRGIPDLLAYDRWYNLNLAHLKRAATKYHYNPTVFFAPAWAEIYTTDTERTMSFEATQNFGAELHAIYRNLGYTLAVLPLVSVEERVAWIMKSIKP